jgi:Zn-dependent protease
MLIFAGFGWAKPVPVNPYKLKQKSKAGLMFVSIAGPSSNLILAVLAAIPLRFNLVPLNIQSSSFLPTFAQFLFEFVVINITLFLFNLLPLAPLDGEKVLAFFLPTQWESVYNKIKVYGPFVLLFFAIIGPRIGFDLIGIVIRQPMVKLTNLLLGWNL